MNKTIIGIAFLLSMSLHAMENTFIDPRTTEMAIYQRDFWRFKKRLENQPTNRCAQLYKNEEKGIDDFATLQEWAREALVIKRSSNPVQFLTIGTIEDMAKSTSRTQTKKVKKIKNNNKGKKRKKKSQNIITVKHVSFKLCFPDTKTHSSTERYCVKDVYGNYTVYGTSIAEPDLPKEVLERMAYAQKVGMEPCNKERFELPDGDNLEIYYLNNRIESYKDKKREISYLASLAFEDPDHFVQQYQEQINDEAMRLRKEGVASGNEIRCLIDQKKDLIMYNDLLKKYVKKLFHEKKLYAFELKRHIKSIDESARNRETFCIIDQKAALGDKEAISEIYAFKDQGNYYLYGVLLEPDAQDAEFQINARGRVYQFADQLAEWIPELKIDLDSQHFPPSQIEPQM